MNKDNSLETLKTKYERIEILLEKIENLDEPYTSLDKTRQLIERVGLLKEEAYLKYYESGLSFYLHKGNTNAEKEKFLKEGAQKKISTAMFHLAQMYFKAGNANEALIWLVKAAELKEKNAMFDYAKRLEQGRQVSKDKKEAVKWYILCAEMNQYKAQKKLSQLYFSDDKSIRNEIKGIYWHEVLAKNGDFDSQQFLAKWHYKKEDYKKAFHYMLEVEKEAPEMFQRELGDMLYQGKGLDKNVARAFEYYEKLAENDDNDLRKLLAESYWDGQGIKKNTKKAIEYFELIWNELDEKRLEEIGDFYQKNSRRKSSVELAIIWYKRAAKKGNMNCLEYLIENDDSDENIKWMESLAKLDDIKYQKKLGEHHYAHGEIDLAITWYERAATLKDLESQLKLMDIYTNETGYKNPDHLYKWSLEAANQGEPSAQFLLYTLLTQEDESLKWLEKSADQGYQKAVNQLGITYYVLASKDKADYSQALQWLLKAKKSDDETIDLYLGNCYYHAQGTDKDLKKAYDYYSRWENKTGNFISEEKVYSMGNHFYYGEDKERGIQLFKRLSARAENVEFHKSITEIFRDNQLYSEAFKLELKMGQQGDHTFCLPIADAYYSGKGVKKDINESLAWYKKAYQFKPDAFVARRIGDICFSLELHDQGIEYYKKHLDDYACEKLGIHFYEADKKEKAYQYLSKCLHSMNGKVQYYAGMCNLYGTGTVQDYTLARECFLKALACHCHEANESLGMMYEIGCGVERDISKAIEYYERAVQSGISNPQYELFHFYFKGIGIPADWDKAENYVDHVYWEKKNKTDRKAFNEMYQIQDGEDAFFELGKKYYLGILTEKDISKAIKYYTMSYELGNLKAVLNLAKIYHHEKGFKDIGKAYKFYEMACDNGEDEAMLAIGNFYEQGTIVKKNRYKAMDYYGRAKSAGNWLASVYLENLEKLIENEELERERQIKERERQIKERALQLEQEKVRRELQVEKDRVRREQEKKEELKNGPYFMKDAKKGDTFYQRRLAEWYMDHGEKQLAIKWYKKAAKKGDYSSRYELENMGYKVKKRDYKATGNALSYFAENKGIFIIFIILEMIMLMISLMSSRVGTTDYLIYGLAVPLVLGAVFYFMAGKEVAFIETVVGALVLTFSIFALKHFGILAFLGSMFQGVAYVFKKIWSSFAYVFKQIGYSFSHLGKSIWKLLGMIVESFKSLFTLVANLF